MLKVTVMITVSEGYSESLRSTVERAVVEEVTLPRELQSAIDDAQLAIDKQLSDKARLERRQKAEAEREQAETRY
jgi:hypothetical protein